MVHSGLSRAIISQSEREGGVDPWCQQMEKPARSGDTGSQRLSLQKGRGKAFPLGEQLPINWVERINNTYGIIY